MVYLAEYEPSGYSFPNGKIVAGNTGALKLVDNTPDGGRGLVLDVASSGRVVAPESVPTRIEWQSRGRTQDVESIFVRSVSGRFRDLIEWIEPDVHQFLPLEFVNSGGSVIDKRWFWQVCNRLDSVDGERDGWHLEKPYWRFPKNQKPIFKNAIIKDSKFWCERYCSGWFFMSDEAMAHLNENDISGLALKYYESR